MAVVQSVSNASEKRTHQLTLKARQNLLLTGVEAVEGFDEAEIEAVTVQGRLMIRGEKLHISRFSEESGELLIDGRIDTLAYTEPTKSRKKGLQARRQR